MMYVMKKYDVIIIGAGAAGLSAARVALARDRSVLIIDMSDRPARKVLVSGGGRCNFTNTAAGPDRYFGKNPNFVRSVLAQVKPTDILEWATDHGLEYIEKSPGQYFCATGAEDVVDALMQDINDADITPNTQITNIEKNDDGFVVYAKNAVFHGTSVIIATGGTSYSNLVVSDFGYVIAKKFGHKIIPVEPALVGLKTNLFSPDLAGTSLDVEIKIGKKIIKDSLLFTHVGIGGPAAYRASLYDLDTDFYINFLPETNVYEWLKSAKQSDGKKSLQTLLMQRLPNKFAKWLADDTNKNIADYKDTDLKNIAAKVNNFTCAAGSLKRRDLNQAEVVRGGVSTDQVSSKTMESKLCPGLFFAGEVLDITGDLGGFNLHFAWASGIVAGNYA